jgi:hypothetical protein
VSNKGAALESDLNSDSRSCCCDSLQKVKIEALIFSVLESKRIFTRKKYFEVAENKLQI